MRYYKNENNEIFAYDNEQVSNGLSEDKVEITKEEVDAINEAKKNEAFDALSYAEKRQAEYAKLNQDEMRYDDMVNGTNTWVEAIEAIKAKYPKPEEK
jgi:hypothetical protein